MRKFNFSLLGGLLLLAAPAMASSVRAESTPVPVSQQLLYPAWAKKAGIEGVVRLQVDIDPQGQVTDIRLENDDAHPALREAAITSVRQWRFTPQTQDGEVIPATLSIPIRFQLLANRRQPDTGLGPASLKSLW